MKYFLAASLMILSSLAMASGSNPDEVNVIYSGDDATLRIKGESAQEMYNLLTVEESPTAGGSLQVTTKNGKNVACSRTVRIKNSEEVVYYVCQVKFDSSGAAYAN